MHSYFRLELLGGEMTGLSEEITEQAAMKVLKQHWNNPNVFLDQGERLTVNGYVYWKRADSK